MILLTILFILVAPTTFLTDETRTMLRALGRAAGCASPAISAQSRDNQQMEITVVCPPIGRTEP